MEATKKLTAEEQIKEDKKIAKRAYMRNWKRARYAEDPKSIQLVNRIAYYKRHYDTPKEDVEKLGEALPLVSRITSGLEELRELDVEAFRDIIRKYNFEVPDVKV
jgi:hypothetical protein